MTSLLTTLAYEVLRIRRIEEAIADRYKEQKMRCPVHLSIGQEAIAVGVCQALKRSDYVVSNHRAHAHYLAKGGDFKRMLAEIYGKKEGCCKGRGGSMHLVDLEVGFLGSTPIVGGSMPVAVGTAFGSFLRGERERITCVFFGEGATEEGVFMECLNFAALKKLPVLFICENNLYSVYSPMDVRQPSERDRAAIARAHGIPTDAGDGNNVEEVVQKTRDAVASIRAGKGSYFLEFSTYRFREHCGPNVDDDLGYRTLEEVALWKPRCPVEQIQHLVGDEMETMIAQEIQDAFAFAESSPFPTEDEGGLYA